MLFVLIQPRGCYIPIQLVVVVVVAAAVSVVYNRILTEKSSKDQGPHNCIKHDPHI